METWNYQRQNTDYFYCKIIFKITCRIRPATVSLKEDSLYSTITKCHLRQLYCEPHKSITRKIILSERFWHCVLLCCWGSTKRPLKGLKPEARYNQKMRDPVKMPVSRWQAGTTRKCAGSCEDANSLLDWPVQLKIVANLAICCWFQTEYLTYRILEQQSEI